MRRIMLKSKLHNATITRTELSYAGSITIDPLLLAQVDIFEYERVQVVNINNGARFETYVISGKPGDRQICLNGPAARLGQPGDRVHILAFATMSEDELKAYRPRVCILDERNEMPEKNM